MALEQHHLPLLRTADVAIVVGPSVNFLPVQVVATFAAAQAEPATLKRLAKTVIRQFFHPLHDGPGPDTSAETDLALADLENALRDISGVTDVALE